MDNGLSLASSTQGLQGALGDTACGLQALCAGGQGCLGRASLGRLIGSALGGWRLQAPMADGQPWASGLSPGRDHLPFRVMGPKSRTRAGLMATASLRSWLLEQNCGDGEFSCHANAKDAEHARCHVQHVYVQHAWGGAASPPSFS